MIRITRESRWAGNGFGTETMHTARREDGTVVGEWHAKIMGRCWVLTPEGGRIPKVAYRDWMAAIRRLERTSQ